MSQSLRSQTPALGATRSASLANWLGWLRNRLTVRILLWLLLLYFLIPIVE